MEKLTLEEALKRGVEAHRAGNLNEADHYYTSILNINPDYSDANHNLGVLAVSLDKRREALPYFKRALDVNPSVELYWESYVDALVKLGEFADAEALIKGAKAQSLSVELLNKLEGLLAGGARNLPQKTLDHLMALYNQGELDQVVTQAQALTGQYPTAYMLWNTLGVANKGLRRTEAAYEAFKKVIELNPKDAGGFNNLGATLQESGKLAEAVEAFEYAIKLKPDYAEAYGNLGNLFQKLGKISEAIEAYLKAIALKPDYPEVHCNLGNAFFSQNKMTRAIAAYDEALLRKSNLAVVHHNKAIIFEKQNKLKKAIETYVKALGIEPNYASARAHKLDLQARICDWEMIKSDTIFLKELGINRSYVAPLTLLTFEDEPDRHFLRSRLYVDQKFLNSTAAHYAKPCSKPARLRLGYFSSDFREHPVSRLMAKVIECHDRKKFEVFAYSFGPPKDGSIRERLVNAFDNFRECYGLSDDKIVENATSDKLDIAIDLTGHTRDSRSGIFARRLSPIQINYLGYPGTMGASFMDYIIADVNLIPEEYQQYYSEKPIYLPHHYQAQDDELEIASETPTRASLGLPEKGFVFCAINNTYKITEREFDIWMRLLHNVEGSVIWLLETNKWARENLQKEALARGIEAERLVFVKRTTHAEYLAQFRQADLYLDTFNYNAGATASNALWAGLPVLTKRGKSYTARMASSLLKSIGLPELITTTELEYENLALQLAQNPKQLTSIRRKLAVNRRTMPLFNTKLFTKHLEDGYQRAYQRYFDGKKPKTIFVPE